MVKLSKDLLQAVDSGKISLQLADPRGFDNAKLYRVTVTAAAASKFATRAKTVAKITANTKGAIATSWGDPATNKVDETMANFVDKAATLRPSEYQPELKISDLTEVVNFSYADQKGSPLGTLTLYKRSRAAASRTKGITLVESNHRPAAARLGQYKFSQLDLLKIQQLFDLVDFRNGEIGFLY